MGGSTLQAPALHHHYQLFSAMFLPPSSTNTVSFIPWIQVPNDSKVTCGCITAQICPQNVKADLFGLTVGGDHLNYSGIVSTLTAKHITLDEMGHPQPAIPILTDKFQCCWIC
jgi:hypothetical protein